MPTVNTQVIPPGVKKWYGPPVLTAYGCALLERFTGKSYTYQAINMETGAAAHICRRAKPIDETEYNDISGKIRTSGVADGPDFRIDVKRDKRISTEKLEEILEHIFTVLLPEHGYSYRKEQAALSSHILAAFCCRAVSLSDAGVGIGKTHAYLIAAALVKRGRVNDIRLKVKYPSISCISEMPVVVATSSIALQDAIAQDYIPEISQILQKYGIITKPLSCVVRKGKEHYICERRLAQFYSQTMRPELKQLISPLLSRLHGVDLDDVDYLDKYAKSRIKVAGRCGRCTMSDSCRYIDFMKDAQSDKYDFQICNHNYFLADILRRSRDEFHLIPHYQSVVIDEAHKFIGAARQMYGTELSILALPKIADAVSGFVFQQSQSTDDLRQIADNLRSQAIRLFRVLTKTIPSNDYDDEAVRFKIKIDGEAIQNLRNISDHLESLTAMLQERQVLRKHASKCKYVMRQLEKFREQIATFESHDDLIYWLEAPEGLLSRKGKVSENALICAIPKRMGEMLHDDLWSKGIWAPLPRIYWESFTVHIKYRSSPVTEIMLSRQRESVMRKS